MNILISSFYTHFTIVFKEFDNSFYWNEILWWKIDKLVSKANIKSDFYDYYHVLLVMWTMIIF